MSESESIVSVIRSQLPFVMLLMRDGVDINFIYVVVGFTVLIYLFNFLFSKIKIIFFNYIHKNKCTITFNEDSFNDYGTDTFKNLSVFLSEYFPETMNRCYTSHLQHIYCKVLGGINLSKCIITPSEYYSNDILLDKNIIDKLCKKGYIFDKNVNIGNLSCYKININYSKVKNTVKLKNKDTEKTSNGVELTCKNSEVLRDFLYIVNNFRHFEERNTEKFKLCYKRECINESKWRTKTAPVSINKTFDNIYLSKQNYDLIKKSIDTWLNSRKIYKKRGIPYKKGFLFTGSPGCGKTSAIYAIASYTKKNIHALDLKNMTNNDLFNISTQLSNCVVLIEDADSFKVLHSRENKKNLILDSHEDDKYKKENSTYLERLTLESVLSFLDGNTGLDRCIVIITTNHPEMLDSAIVRSGRIDHHVFFDKCGLYEFKNIMKSYFSDHPNYNSNLNKMYPGFIFKDNYYSTSYLINTVILPNENNPVKVLQILSENNQ